MDAIEQIHREIENCQACSTDEDGDIDKCREHKYKLEQARQRQDQLTDPQRNRTGVRGDPTPDSAYRDQPPRRQ